MAVRYINEVITVAHTFEQLRTAAVGRVLWPIISSLSESCHNQLIVSALLVLKWHYASMEPDDRGLYQTRGYACEIVAWRFLTHLSEPELINYLLSDLPSCDRGRTFSPTEENSLLRDEEILDLRFDTITSGRLPQDASHRARRGSAAEEEDPTSEFVGLNALEIAAVAEAKRFLSQRVVQNIVNSIWNGDIIFWNSMNTHTVKKAQRYTKR